ncbi:MAG: helix-turn-helix domain-containing protein, partial [Coriobacteriia bacterium]|nr:helix-turn-helix domain-containing protein [Coriobacteriia bacterium]
MARPAGAPDMHVVIDHTAGRAATVHQHTLEELLIVQEGVGVLEMDRTSYRLRSGDAVLVPGSRAHHCVSNDHLKATSVMFPHQAMRGLTLSSYPDTTTSTDPVRHRMMAQRLRPARVRLSPEKLAEALELINTADDELRSRGTGYRMAVILRVMELMLLVNRCLLHVSGASKASDPVQRAIAFIEHNYTAQIDNSMLAEIACTSPRNLLRRFRRSTGCSPHQYLQSTRLDHACRLLADSDHSVTRIAELVGIADSNYLSRLFRGNLETSPREYRRFSRAVAAHPISAHGAHVSTCFAGSDGDTKQRKECTVDKWLLIGHPFIVDSTEGLARTLHQPQKYEGNPVLSPDRPWEHGNAYAYARGTVIPGDGEHPYRMWYQSGNEGLIICYATSEDGIAWQKP